MWDAHTGKALQVFDNIVPHDITAVCFDDRKRKFVVGDVDGNVGVFACATGASPARTPTLEAPTQAT